MKTSITFVTPEEMKKETGDNYFGYSVPSTGLVLILNNLPDAVTQSVIAHEMYHVNDKDFYTSSVFMRELRANVAGFKASPKGFFYGIFLSLTPSRIWLYVRRAFGGF